METQYATNTILRGKFRGINTCIKKNKDIKYTAQLYISRNQKKKDKLNSEDDRMKEITKIRAEINEIEARNRKKSTKLRSGFLKDKLN